MPITPAAPQPETEGEARLRAAQIIGHDLAAPAAYTGNWHQALQDTAAHWATDTPAHWATEILTGQAPASS